MENQALYFKVKQVEIDGVKCVGLVVPHDESLKLLSVNGFEMLLTDEAISTLKGARVAVDTKSKLNELSKAQQALHKIKCQKIALEQSIDARLLIELDSEILKYERLSKLILAELPNTVGLMTESQFKDFVFEKLGYQGRYQISFQMKSFGATTLTGIEIKRCVELGRWLSPSDFDFLEVGEEYAELTHISDYKKTKDFKRLCQKYGWPMNFKPSIPGWNVQEFQYLSIEEKESCDIHGGVEISPEQPLNLNETTAMIAVQLLSELLN